VNAAAVDAGPHLIDLRNVHRGDRITLRGKWDRGEGFRAFRIESVLSRTLSLGPRAGVILSRNDGEGSPADGMVCVHR